MDSGTDDSLQVDGEVLGILTCSKENRHSP